MYIHTAATATYIQRIFVAAVLLSKVVPVCRMQAAGKKFEPSQKSRYVGTVVQYRPASSKVGRRKYEEHLKDPTMAAKENKGAGEESKAEQEIDPEVNDDGEDDVVDPDGDGEQGEPEEPEIKLYKSTRIKGYITLIVASVINFDSAQKSVDVKATNAVPSTVEQRRYAISVALVTLILSTAILLMHLDRITMFKKAWTKAFQPKSKIELGLALFQVIWWSVAVGVETSVQGIAGDGKGQYSLYYSSWGCW
jgi:hypothetical protein